MRATRCSTSSARSAKAAMCSGSSVRCRLRRRKATCCWSPTRARTAWRWPIPTTCGHCPPKTCWMKSMAEWQFDRDAIQAFRFVRCDFDARSGVARLVYAFDHGPELVETITVPGAPFALDASRASAVERALRLLHLVAGVSYYKAAAPQEIRIESYAVDAETAMLLETLYLNGLGEFAYRNG